MSRSERRAARLTARTTASATSGSPAPSGSGWLRPSCSYMASRNQARGGWLSGQPSMHTARISCASLRAGITAAPMIDDLPAPDGPYTMRQRWASTLAASSRAMSLRPKKSSRSPAW